MSGSIKRFQISRVRCRYQPRARKENPVVVRRITEKGAALFLLALTPAVQKSDTRRSQWMDRLNKISRAKHKKSLFRCDSDQSESKSASIGRASSVWVVVLATGESSGETHGSPWRPRGPYTQPPFPSNPPAMLDPAQFMRVTPPAIHPETFLPPALSLQMMRDA